MPLNQFNSIQLNKQLGRSSKHEVDRHRLADLTIVWYLFYVGVRIIQLPHKLINRMIPSYHSNSRSMTSD